MKTREYRRLFEEESSSFWHRGRRRLIRNLLQHFASPRKGPSSHPLRILDVGCGTGGNFPVLKKFGQVIGCDLEAEPLRLARRRFPQAQWLQTNAVKLPFPANSFNLLAALDVLEHIKDEKRALKEWSRVLKKGGLLVLAVPAYRWLWSEHDKFLGHQRRYYASRLKTLLLENGYQPLWVSYFVFSLFPLVLIQRLMLKLKPRGRDAYPSFPGWLNSLLTLILIAETRLLPLFRLPWGSTLVAVARRPSLRR